MMPIEAYILNKKLLEYVVGRFPLSDVELFKRSCAFAESHYVDIEHQTGKSYIRYVSEVAEFLGDIGADPIVLSTVMIYPPPTMSDSILDEIKKEFKNEIALIKLVEELHGLSRFEWNVWPTPVENESVRERQEILRKMYLLAIEDADNEDGEMSCLTATHFQKREKQVENLIIMYLAATTDIRALVIKLADRLHFIKLLKDSSLLQQEPIYCKLLAKITIAIYAPLADLLGMWRLKSDLEDMSFRLLEPDKYKEIANQLAVKKDVRKKYIDDIIPIIREELWSTGIKAEISGRAKHIYSIHQKMEAKQLTLQEINDLLGIRIIVNAIEDCYKVQGILHELYPPVMDFYDGKAGRDWIANPKLNLYQSLHTTIKFEDKLVEIQIRTRTMHEIAEYGVSAAHWRYKESKAYRKGKVHREAWMRDKNQQLAERRKVLNNEHRFVAPALKDLINGRIFVITPKGHVIDLRAGATPLDFAYRIHTDLGHRYTGAKVNGRIVRLDYKLKNGEIVELIKSHARPGPSPEWLTRSIDEEGKSTYVFARTPGAREKIHRELNKQKPRTQK